MGLGAESMGRKSDFRAFKDLRDFKINLSTFQVFTYYF